ncbi:MAG TPA: hypothetical protein ENK91_01380 [Bacteroidetes bacterium]|nr:hypothetical protein [Bacteroidota bacterium]
MKKIVLILSLLVVGLQACYYDNEEELYPSVDTGCNLENVTFSGTISGILSSRCLGCHGNATASSYGDGIKLEDYQDVKNAADGGRLLGAVKHEQGYSKMPLGSAKMDDCKISQIEAWINAGSPNN